MEKARDEFRVFGPGAMTLLPVITTDVIRGKPFRADYEEVHTQKSTGMVERRRGSLAQDSEGRWREDHFVSDPEDPSTTRHVTVIWDSQTMTYGMIDHKTNQVKKMDIGPIIKQPTHGDTKAEGGLPKPPLPTREASRREIPKLLGEKVIEGVLCHGTLYTSEPGDRTVERWLSDRLLRPVLEITSDKDLEMTYRVFNIRLTEPDPSLFVVPSGNP